MRTCLALFFCACTGTPQPTVEPVEAPSRMPVSHFKQEPHVTITPDVDLVPANAVRFTVHSDVPLVLDGHVFAVMRVHNEEAEDVPSALPEWKWDQDIRTATLEPKGLFKGPLYLLASLNMQSQTGKMADFSKEFRVIGADHTAPDASNLTVRGNPEPGSNEPLSLAFPEAMQVQTVHKISTLCGGKPWPGAWRMLNHQTLARFEPAEPWGECVVTVFVNAGIRDLAGNELANRPQGHLMPMVPIKQKEP